MTDEVPQAVLARRLSDLVAEVRRTDEMVRASDPEGVHDLRVAMRRLRSLTATFRPVLGRPDLERLRGELRWAGHELGAVRDLEVVHERLDAALADERLELVMGGVRARLDDHARTQGVASRQRAESLVTSPRYQRLLDRVAELGSEWDPVGLTEDVARDRLRRDWRRLRRRARTADQRPDGSRHEAALHEVRKAAKRARYAAEAMSPVFGRRAERMAELAESVQDALGTHRDTLLTRPLLRELGVRAHLDGDNAFTFGRLHAREESAGAAALDDYADVRADLDRRKLRSWPA